MPQKLLAEAHGKPIAFHDCSGPVTLTASAHLTIARPDVVEQEIARGFYYGWYGQYVTQLPPIENGFIRVPGGAGLGVELNEGRVKVDTAKVLITTA